MSNFKDVACASLCWLQMSMSGHCPSQQTPFVHCSISARPDDTLNSLLSVLVVCSLRSSLSPFSFVRVTSLVSVDSV